MVLKAKLELQAHRVLKVSRVYRVLKAQLV
jgi:hypothetical protein